MPLPPDNILPYANKPRPRLPFRSLSRGFWIALALAALGVFILFCGPSSGDIRLDTGDRRYCYLGIPLSNRPMPEPYRSKLLALANKSPAIPSTWVQCVTYPLPSSNNTDLMCADFYRNVAIWSDEDPTLARLALEDVANYVPRMLSHGGLPEPFPLLTPLIIDHRTNTINPDWRTDAEIQPYLAAHHYTPPPPVTPRPVTPPPAISPPATAPPVTPRPIAPRPVTPPPDTRRSGGPPQE